jgi:hypothetical protein
MAAQKGAGFMGWFFAKINSIMQKNEIKKCFPVY